MIDKKLLKVFNEHRERSYLTCPNNCWCWDVEITLNKQRFQENGSKND